MRFSKETTASLIAAATTATVAMVVVSASSPSHAAHATTTNSNNKSLSLETAANDHDALPPSFFPRLEDHVDAGILTLLSSSSSSTGSGSSGDNYSSNISNSRELQSTSSWCTQGFVDCVAGFVAGSDNSITCTAACVDGGNKCCSGTEACTGFTGKVCKDGISCIGTNACLNAIIPQVKNSCNGDRACRSVAAPATGVSGVTGTVGNIINSCTGQMSCYKLGFNGGTVGNILDSCTNIYACRDLGYDAGTVGSIEGSCTAFRACWDLTNGGGTVGNIKNSCTADKSCETLCENRGAVPGGTVGNITSSCTSQSACETLGAFGGTVGNIVNSCTTKDLSCTTLGYGGVVGNLQDSCSDEKACYKVGYNGEAGNLQASCTAYYSCYYAGYEGSMGNMVNSCTDKKACYKLGFFGVAGDLQDSCTGYYGCYYAGYSGSVGSMVNSCTDRNACYRVGYKGTTRNIQDSCTAENACRNLGKDGTAGNIQGSCTLFAACRNAAYNFGSIGNIISSCKAASACEGAGDSVADAIISSLNNCCNVANVCKDKTEANLPVECKATASPSSAPTTTKTSTPTSAPSASTTAAPTAPQPSTTNSSTKAPTKSPVFVTLTFVGGCPPQISTSAVTDQDHFEPGDRVSKGAIVFECKSWPNSLFCSQAEFTPPDNLDSKSTAWKQAWDVVGHCSGVLTPPVTGCPDVWSPGEITKYKENDQVSVIKSSSPLIQVIYKCKAWPYSWYCGQLSPLNHNGGVLGWKMVGECTGTLSPTASPSFDPLTVIIAGCPEEYNLAAVENYDAGDKVSVAVVGSSSYKNVYVCREFPYSGYCSQSGFAPGEQYDYMAWTILGPCDGTLAPTTAPSAYTGGASCTYTKVVTTTPTPTPVVTPVGTWTAGTLYEASDQVRIGATKFQCKPWPFYLWCRMSTYKPTLSETGLWTEAWTLAGTCPPVRV